MLKARTHSSSDTLTRYTGQERRSESGRGAWAGSQRRNSAVTRRGSGEAVTPNSSAGYPPTRCCPFAEMLMKR
ncbi:hypothetical protein MRX96_014271 [Rhipicephalus microplus]